MLFAVTCGNHSDDDVNLRLGIQIYKCIESYVFRFFSTLRFVKMTFEDLLG